MTILFLANNTFIPFYLHVYSTGLSRYNLQKIIQLVVKYYHIFLEQFVMYACIIYSIISVEIHFIIRAHHIVDQFKTSTA